MSDRSAYSVARYSLLRAAILPRHRAADTLTDLDPDDPGQADALRAHILGMVADPVVREAVEVSSSSLAATLDSLAAGERLSTAKLRRLLLTVTSYRLRMTTRATPFGLMAGVATALSGEPATKVRLGAAHRKRVNVDHGWLTAVLDRWERDPAVLAHVCVVTNNLVVRRGDRLVLPYAPFAGTGPQDRPDEVSVRLTALVEQAIAGAVRPVPFPDLVAEVSASLPVEARERVAGLITGLIAQRVLLTDLRPPSGAEDSLDHVRTVLRRADFSELARLRTVHERVAAYEREPIGTGTRALRDAVAEMAALREGGTNLNVDLAVDADVRLGPGVREEVERAATALWRLTPPTSRAEHLIDYHGEFLERYGAGRLVPVTELLYSARGLGAPAGYLVPASSRTHRPGPEPDAELLALAYRAGWERRREVVLDEDLLARLAPAPESAPTDALDFCASVLAPSVEAVDAGDFRLVTAPFPGSIGGTYAGRFAHLLPDIAAQAAETAGAGGTVLPVQLVFETANPRLGGVAGVPDTPGHRISIGRFADPDDEHELGLDDIAVFATHEGLHLYSRSLERVIRPNSRHMVSLFGQAPNLARFLVEAPVTGRRLWGGWQWRTAADLPFLPRVRYGRTVVASAQWRPPGELRADDLTWPEWRDRFRSWCVDWEVPSTVQVIDMDRRLELDLSCEVHLRLLRQQLGKADASLVEIPCGGEYDAGWLDGRANEIVFSLSPEPEQAEPVPIVNARTSSQLHGPGGEWLFARLYTPANHQDSLLSHRLPALLETLPASVDRWFFIRYRDPEPHLRLRWHGDPHELRNELLPALHDWAADLRVRGEANRLELGSYDPELERYGGPALIEAAEQAFHADSLAVLAQLGRKAEYGSDLLAAINYVDLLRAFDEPDWLSWVTETFPLLERRPAFRRLRERAVRTVDPSGDRARLRDMDPVLASAFENRWAAVRRYGELSRSEPSWSTSDTIMSALLHMHFNRLVGPDRETEFDSIAVTAGVARLHLSRLRVLGS